jgi:hypothetical protein
MLELRNSRREMRRRTGSMNQKLRWLLCSWCFERRGRSMSLSRIPRRNLGFDKRLRTGR